MRSHGRHATAACCATLPGYFRARASDYGAPEETLPRPEWLTLRCLCMLPCSLVLTIRASQPSRSGRLVECTIVLRPQDGAPANFHTDEDLEQWAEANVQPFALWEHGGAYASQALQPPSDRAPGCATHQRTRKRRLRHRAPQPSPWPGPYPAQTLFRRLCPPCSRDSGRALAPARRAHRAPSCEERRG